MNPVVFRTKMSNYNPGPDLFGPANSVLRNRKFFVCCRGRCTAILCYRLREDFIDHMEVLNKDIEASRNVLGAELLIF